MVQEYARKKNNWKTGLKNRNDCFICNQLRYTTYFAIRNTLDNLELTDWD